MGKEGGAEDDLQPGNLLVVRKAKDELVHNAVYPDRSTNKLKRRIIGIIPDEMMPVEVGQSRAPDSSGHLQSSAPSSTHHPYSISPPLRSSTTHSSPIIRPLKGRQEKLGWDKLTVGI